MAASGASAGWYRSNATIPSSTVTAAYTVAVFVQATSAPGTAVARTACGMVGGVAQQNPHLQFDWDHPSSSFYKAMTHRQNDNSYRVVQIGSTIAANVWHHWCLTYDGTNLRGYFNGNLEGTVATSVSINNDPWVSALALVDGSGALEPGADTRFDTGQVAELGIWTEALSGEEVNSLRHGFRATRVRYQSLFFYAPMLRAFGLKDLRGGRDLVLRAGSDVFTDHPRVIG
jgi:hypothetical protein